MKLRHPVSAKRKVIERRLEGESLKRLALAFGLPKSTVQGWIAGLELPDLASKKLLKRARAERIEALSRRRRIIPASLYTSSFSPELVRFFAHTLFDGSIFPDRVVYYSSHLILAEQFASSGRCLFGLKPTWHQTEEGVYRVYFFSKNLVDFLTARRSFLLGNITQMGRSERLAFLKAFFDDEGSVAFRPESGKRVVRGYQKNVEILQLIAELLKGFDIDSRLDNVSRSPELVISCQENIERFSRSIGFSEGVSFLATRKNSYYSQPVEKQAILRRLLRSYAS